MVTDVSLGAILDCVEFGVLTEQGILLLVRMQLCHAS